MSETIVAISTAPGEGGIGIIRVSGSASLYVMQKLMKSYNDKIKERYAYYSKIINKNKKIIDEGIFIFMKGPNSYTGEDMLEIQAHGSNISLKKILRSVLELNNNIRMAEPGEFTKLAFLNGKLDLSQAEAVIDIIKSKSNISLEIAENQYEGRLSNNIKIIRSKLLDILSEMAVNIDYPDEDIEYKNNEEIIIKVNEIVEELDILINSFNIGHIAKEGIKAAIIGKANAGKSSLMNALLGNERVIVTDIPGTTRDVVEENVSINGIPLILIDTAGIRKTDDVIEKIGIEKTKEAINEANLIIYIIDGNRKIDENDKKIINLIKNSKNILIIINKNDLKQEIDDKYIKSIFKNNKIINISLVNEEKINAINEVSTAIEEIFNLGNINISEANIVSNERHYKLLRDAKENLQEVLNMINHDEPLEVVELSVKYAYQQLGNIIGEATGDEIINNVFSKFCLGK